MNLLALNRNLIRISIFSLLFFTARPAYSIPQQLEALCGKFNMSFCAGEKKEEGTGNEEEAEKLRDFTQSEKEILTSLLEHQKRLQLKEQELEQREVQLKSLQEDIQRQIAQLEKLQLNIEKDIEAKKILDSDQFNKAVSFYAKMDSAKAALSIAQLNARTATQILMKLKDKKSSEILSSMPPEKAAQLIQGIANKKTD